MEYYNLRGTEVLCVSGSEIIKSDRNPNGIISASLVKKWQRDDREIVARRACYGQTLLLVFNRIPQRYRDEITLAIGTPAEVVKTKSFREKVVADPMAVTYYSQYALADGRMLPDQAQREYCANAAVLNAINEKYRDAKQARGKLGESLGQFWNTAKDAVNSVRADLGHTLPATEIALSRRFLTYIKDGYAALISGKYCNDNSRKVNIKLENLILSLYAMPNKPFAGQVHSLYHLFLNGKLTVADSKTGEIFDPQEFYVNGKPITLGETTVWNYINLPENRPIVDAKRMGAHRHNATHRPHHHRTAPEYAFSKISMDDRDLPRKCSNGKWVKAYYAYDVASGSIVGYAHNLYKTEELFLDCLRNMLRLIEREGYGMPLEVEVENHLVNKFFDDLALMFPYMRVCRPGNSQEKRAEHFNKAKKYGAEKKTQNGIGRWWSRHEAYTVDRDKINDEFVEKLFSFEQLVADDIASINLYNSQPHPKQNRYPGLTRWQVLEMHMNPNTPEISKPIVYKSIGYKTETSLRRNQYVTVQGGKYQIPSISTLEKLTPHNYSVDAYWLPDVEGMISEVYVYQNGVFICKAERIVNYQESQAERTPADLEAFTNQAKFVSQFDKKIKDGKNELAAAVIIESEVLRDALDTPAVVAPQQEQTEQEDSFDFSNDDFTGSAEDAIDSL